MINILGVAKSIKACPNCGCYIMEYREVGPHIGKYCNNCNKWIKWVSRKEVPDELAARITFDNTVPENMWDDTDEEDAPWF
jgi:hypothetical protein